ncbi:MAG: QueT transporter family protein [Candidatus Zixiibacteriota bacterium]
MNETAQAGLIAAAYALLGLVFYPISFGVYQVRVAEALTVLPFLSRAAVPGLFVGCLIANFFGGMGWQDVVFGSLLTLVAAVLTRLIAVSVKSRHAWLLAPLPPVLVNALGVSLYLAPIIDVSYWFAVQMIGLGQVAACFVLGMPLLRLLQSRASLFGDRSI